VAVNSSEVGGLEWTAPTEAEIRVVLRYHLEGSAASGSVIEELWIPLTHERVDVALVDSTLKAFEIKSERDNLSRLGRQVGAYSRLFDECTVVLAERHLPLAQEMLPPWWGVWVIAEGSPVRFNQLRLPAKNPSIDCETLVRLLWRDELQQILTLIGERPPAKAGRAWMWAALLKCVDQQDLRQTVAQALLRRDPASARIPTKRFLTASSAIAG